MTVTAVSWAWEENARLLPSPIQQAVHGQQRLIRDHRAVFFRLSNQPVEREISGNAGVTNSRAW
jgi:hypothetical protein